MSKIAKTLKPLAVNEGFTESFIPGIKFYKSSRSIPYTPLIYHPSIIIVGQGKKVGRLGNQTFFYDPSHYLVLSIPMSYECKTQIGKDGSFLALSIDMDIKILYELLSQMESPLRRGGDREYDLKKGICSVPMHEDMENAAIRLLETLKSKEESDILGQSLVREVFYRALKGQHAPTLYALAEHNSVFSRISRVLHHIQTELKARLTVEELATRAHMSESSFYRCFKTTTSYSPLQYVKNVRLNKAKEFMIAENLSVEETSRRVGYESVSQFSREFKRHFGRSPKEEAQVRYYV